MVHQQKRKWHFCFEYLWQNQSMIKLGYGSENVWKDSWCSVTSISHLTICTVRFPSLSAYERICMGQSLSEGPLPSSFFFIDCSLCMKSLLVPGSFVSMPCLEMWSRDCCTVLNKCSELNWFISLSAQHPSMKSGIYCKGDTDIIYFC